VSARERGSVTVVTAAIAGVMVASTLFTADLGTVLIARERARASADAAALAAAQELALPTSGTPQEQATDYAVRNGGSLVDCECVAGTQEATVRVRVSIDHLFLFPGSRVVEATARAVVDLPGA
jgi:secretion/DNA translocation related TadE-like protein